MKDVEFYDEKDLESCERSAAEFITLLECIRRGGPFPITELPKSPCFGKDCPFGRNRSQRCESKTKQVKEVRKKSSKKYKK